MGDRLYLALVSAKTAPKVGDRLCDLDEIPAGNGYAAGGQALDPVWDFFVAVVGDEWMLRIRKVTFYASGGSIPINGLPIRYAVLTDGTPWMQRKVRMTWDLGSDYILTAKDTLHLETIDIILSGQADEP